MKPGSRASLLCAVLALAGCASVPGPASSWITPQDAVRAANDDPRHGITGTFVLEVRAIGREDGRVYLNSERDYRHQACLTISMSDATADALAARLHTPLENLRNRRLRVAGTARRVTIHFTGPAGQPSGKYYFQTHVQVDDPGQVAFAP